MAEVWVLLEILRKRQQIPRHYNDHPLSGKWKGWNDCHTEGDFLVIWRYAEADDGSEEVLLAACGTHAHLF
ncbi:type II toxin-antitoxin system YafQ family toxin [Xanthomonas translucens pv. poae]|jgi:mRNA interferase YafQ|nr:type II toxin-antitoxin system YafQ family toxin [Xanthomonas translucens pv. poae]